MGLTLIDIIEAVTVVIAMLCLGLLFFFPKKRPSEDKVERQNPKAPRPRLLKEAPDRLNKPNPQPLHQLSEVRDA